MKIGPSAEAIRYLNSVHEKPDSSGENGQKSGQQHQRESEEDEKNPEVIEVSDEKVGAAIESFKSDAQTQANGLSAELQGNGPGLRVVLKDGSGAVVRQFTGEEFLKVREAVTQKRTRGKILDQKA